MNYFNLQNQIEAFDVDPFIELEQGLHPGEISIERLLAKYPERQELLHSIIDTLDVPDFGGRIITSLGLPKGVIGAYTPEGNIIIYPNILLFGTEIDIAQVAAHELLHFELSQDNDRPSDESVTELMTKQKMKMIYGVEDIQSGYDHLVDELWQYFGDIPYEQLMEMMQAGNQQTLDKVADLLIVRPSAQRFAVEELTWFGIQNKLMEVWPQLLRLFPRLVNSFEGNGAGVHEDATMAARDFDLESLQKSAIAHFEQQPELITKIFDNVTGDDLDFLSWEDVAIRLQAKGYGYILELGSTEVLSQIESYITEFNLSYTEV